MPDRLTDQIAQLVARMRQYERGRRESWSVSGNCCPKTAADITKEWADELAALLATHQEPEKQPTDEEVIGRAFLAARLRHTGAL